MCEDFMETPLGIHARRNVHRDNFIDKFNNFWVWQDHRKIWGEMGKPDPFDDGDVSIVQFMQAQMANFPVIGSDLPDGTMYITSGGDMWPGITQPCQKLNIDRDDRQEAN